MPKTRSEARTAAFKILFEARLRGPETLTDLEATLTGQNGDTEHVDFARALVEGVTDRSEELLEMIRAHATNWDPGRIATTDLVILQLALFEMDLMGQAAPVAIDEAVELAKTYGGADSPAFVNGVLDSWHKARSNG